jgi:hypothetical protein
MEDALSRLIVLENAYQPRRSAMLNIMHGVDQTIAHQVCYGGILDKRNDFCRRAFSGRTDI